MNTRRIKLALIMSLLLFSCMVKNEDTLKHSAPSDSATNHTASVTPLQEDLLFANMYKLQEMLETYALDHKNTYPESLELLYKAANKKDNVYFKPIENPITNLSWNDQNPEANGIIYLINEKPFRPGSLVYESVIDSHGKITRYRIWRTDKQGKLLPQTLKNYSPK